MGDWEQFGKNHINIMNKKRKTYRIQQSNGDSLKVAEATRSYLVSEDFLATPEEEIEILSAMENLLQRAKEFALAFARVNIPTERDRLVAQIRTRLESRGIKIFEIELSFSPADLLVEIREKLKAQNFFESAMLRVARNARQTSQRRIVFVYGIERSILSSETYHPTLAVLNYKRESFRKEIAAPVVFWLPEYAMQAIAEGAPDFWAWRSGVFEFLTSPQESERM